MLSWICIIINVKELCEKFCDRQSDVSTKTHLQSTVFIVWSLFLLWKSLNYLNYNLWIYILELSKKGENISWQQIKDSHFSVLRPFRSFYVLAFTVFDWTQNRMQRYFLREGKQNNFKSTSLSPFKFNVGGLNSQ